MIFMYVTTMAGTLVTAYNLYASILSNPHVAGQPINVLGAVAMIIVAILLFAAALLIAYDAWGAWQKLRASPLRPARSFCRSEEHTSELQSQSNLVCRLLLEKKKKRTITH